MHDQYQYMHLIILWLKRYDHSIVTETDKQNQNSIPGHDNKGC